MAKMTTAQYAELIGMKAGDKVRLTENVRHAEFRGLTGTIQRVIKSRKIVDVMCDNGKSYGALPENVEIIAKC